MATTSASVGVQENQFSPSPQRWFQALIHCSQCQDAVCGVPRCQKMKRVVQHTKRCTKGKTNGGCPICKHLIFLCCKHAKQCQQQTCPVPFCLGLQHKLRQFELQRRQQQLLRRQDLCEGA